VIAAALALAAGAATAAHSATPPSSVSAPRTTTVTPQVTAPGGRLQAQGAGAVSIEGSLVVFGLIQGRGSLLVQDLEGDGKVTLAGRKRSLGRTGTLRLPRATGRFYIAGSRLRVRIAGPKLVASAAGRGRFLLEGIGQLVLNGGPTVTWPDPPEPQDLLPPVQGSSRSR
jgi:hypothetical protein